MCLKFVCFSFMVSCIVLPAIPQVGEGKAIVSVRLHSYANAQDRKNDGTCCTEKFGLCTDHCVPTFALCLGQQDSKKADKFGCSFGKLQQSGIVSSKNSLTFSSTIGRLKNPVVWILTKWPGSVQLNIRIRHADDGLIALWSETLIFHPQIGFPHSKLLRLETDFGIRLTATVRVTCLFGYFGNGCSKFCNSSTQNHYKCDTAGRKSCEPGWEGENCTINSDDCKDKPCNNGGTCHDRVNDFQCSCAEGFEGHRCETEKVTECTHSGLCNNGVCEGTVGSYTCKCNKGFSGVNCSIYTDFCDSQPCLNGGLCETVRGDIICTCPEQYSGATCANDVNECIEHNPCRAGSTCKNLNGSFQCSCPPGLRGQLCDEDIDECTESSPCLNGGTCINSLGSFSCLCPSTATGSLCENDINECEDGRELCQNGATCENLHGGFKCHCTESWTGAMCDVLVDHCFLRPCRNGGKCVNSIQGYTCKCQRGWLGDNCDVDLDECGTNEEVCWNGGTCHNVPGGFSCHCTNGWRGQICDQDVDECSSKRPCHDKHGQCENTAGSFVCHCNFPWTGRVCETNVTRVNECVDNPSICGDHGTCETLNGSFWCVCSPSFTGSLCDTDLNECAVDPDSCNKPGNFTRRLLPEISRSAENFDNRSSLHSEEMLGNNRELDNNNGSLLGIYTSTSVSVSPTPTVNAADVKGRLVCGDGWTGQGCDTKINQTPREINGSQETSTGTPTGLASTLHTGDVSQSNNTTTGNSKHFSSSQVKSELDTRRASPSSGISQARISENDLNITRKNASIHQVKATPDNMSTTEDSYSSSISYRDHSNHSKPRNYSTTSIPVTQNTPARPKQIGTNLLSVDNNQTNQTASFSELSTASTLSVMLNVSHTTVPTIPKKVNKNIVPVVMVPFFLRGKVPRRERGVINSGLTGLFKEIPLFKEKQIAVQSAFVNGLGSNGEKVTKVHPVVKVDGRTLTDQEVNALLSKVSYKFSNFIKVPLYTGELTDKSEQFVAEPFEDEFSGSWIAAPIIAALLLLILLLAVLVNLVRRYQKLCPFIYHENGKREEQDSTSGASHDNEAFEQGMEEDGESKEMDGVKRNNNPKSLMNPMYDGNDICRGTVPVEELRPKARARSGSDYRSSVDSGDGQPDGQPSETEGKSVVHTTNHQTEVTVHHGWTGEMAANAVILRTLPCRPRDSNRSFGNSQQPSQDSSNSHGMDSDTACEESSTTDMIGPITHKYETVDCYGYLLDQEDNNLDSNGTTDHGKMDSCNTNCKDAVCPEEASLNSRTTLNGGTEPDIGRAREQDTQQNVVRQTVMQMKPIVNQVTRQESRSVEIRQQLTRQGKANGEVAKIRTSTPSLLKCDLQRLDTEEDNYDRFKNLRYIDEPVIINVTDS